MRTPIVYVMCSASKLKVCIGTFYTILNFSLLVAVLSAHDAATATALFDSFSSSFSYNILAYPIPYIFSYLTVIVWQAVPHQCQNCLSSIQVLSSPCPHTKLSLGPLLGIPAGNEDENIDGISDKIFDGTLLGPELGVIDGNQLWSNNGTQLSIPLSTSDDTKYGSDDGVFD